MNFTEQKDKLEEKLEQLIDSAVAKVGGDKENDLCKYLPVPTGGYMHHFTMRKMKTENPSELVDLIQKHILEVDRPGKVPPKPRAARGSRKRNEKITLTQTDLERMLNIARLAGDKEMISKLTPKKSINQIKKDLIATIRQGRADHLLWNAYIEAINTQNNTSLNQAQQSTEDLKRYNINTQGN